jgi:predicted ATP-dependent serine protease
MAIPPGKITCIRCGGVFFGTPKASGANDFGIIQLSKVEHKPLDRYVTGVADRLWGSEDAPGVVTSSVTLFGGEPGSGKSTFFLQVMHALWKLTGRPSLYLSFEESVAQVLDRAVRLGIPVEAILVLTKQKWDDGNELTRAALKHYKPAAVVLDSIQKMGGIEEALYYCERFKALAQLEKIPFYVVCQINSSNDFAGGKKIQHEPDTLIYVKKVLEIQGTDKRVHSPPDFRAEIGGAEAEPFRIFVVLKNRFGTECERYFIMRKIGLVPWEMPKPGEEEEDEDGEEDERDEGGKARYPAR